MSNERLRAISRRQFLKEAGTAAFLAAIAPALLSCAKEEKGLLTSAPEKEFVLDTAASLTVKEHKTSETLDLDYVNNLFSELRKEKVNTQERVQAVVDNLNLVYITSGAIGTTFKIDESGYYMTASHVVTDFFSNPYLPSQEPIIIIDLKGGELNPVNNIIFSPEREMALIFAPTGKSRKPVSNLEISNNELQKGDKLWQLALSAQEVERGLNVIGVVLSGNVDSIHYNPYDVRKDLIRVKGMIPFGGSSGSPIVDSKGRIVGIKSGVYLNSKENDRKNYEGSLISHIKYAENLPTTGRFFTYYEHGIRLDKPQALRF